MIACIKESQIGFIESLGFQRLELNVGINRVGFARKLVDGSDYSDLINNETKWLVLDVFNKVYFEHTNPQFGVVYVDDDEIEPLMLVSLISYEAYQEYLKDIKENQPCTG